MPRRVVVIETFLGDLDMPVVEYGMSVEDGLPHHFVEMDGVRLEDI